MKKIYLQIILFLNLFVAIIWYYPRIVDFLIVYNRHYSIPTDEHEIDLIAERGTFGDMFGLLNTIFSGFALLGVVYTLYDENERIRKEKEELREKKAKSDLNKLIFYRDIGKLIFSDISSFLKSMDDWIEANKTNQGQVSVFNYYIIDSHYELLTKNINFEEYYNCYVERYNSREILNINRYVEFSYIVQKQVLKLLDDYTVKSNHNKKEILNLHTKLSKIVAGSSFFRQHFSPVRESLISKNIDLYMQEITEFENACSGFDNADIKSNVNDMLVIYNDCIEDLNTLKDDIKKSQISLKQAHGFLNENSVKLSTIS